MTRAGTVAQLRNAQGGTDPQWLFSQCKGDILAGFWGDAVEIDDGARMTWMHQPHYYMGRHPYTCTVGLLAAKAMAGLVADEGPPAVERWLQVNGAKVLSSIKSLVVAGVASICLLLALTPLLTERS